MIFLSVNAVFAQSFKENVAFFHLCAGLCFAQFSKMRNVGKLYIDKAAAFTADKMKMSARNMVKAVGTIWVFYTADFACFAKLI